MSAMIRQQFVIPLNTLPYEVQYADEELGTIARDIFCELLIPSNNGILAIILPISINDICVLFFPILSIVLPSFWPAPVQLDR